MSWWKNRVKPRIKQPLGGRNRRHGTGVLNHSNGGRGGPAWPYTFGFTGRPLGPSAQGFSSVLHGLKEVSRSDPATPSLPSPCPPPRPLHTEGLSLEGSPTPGTSLPNTSFQTRERFDLRKQRWSRPLSHHGRELGAGGVGTGPQLVGGPHPNVQHVAGIHITFL